VSVQRVACSYLPPNSIYFVTIPTMPKKSTARKRTAGSRKRAKYSSRKSPLRGRRKRKSNKQKVLARLIAILTLFIASTLFLFGIGLYRVVNKKLASALSPSSYGLFQEDLFTLLYIPLIGPIYEELLSVESATFLIIDKRSGRVIGYRMPGDFVMDVSGRFGEEPLANVVSLGCLAGGDSVTDGVELLRSTVGKFFGLNVDRYLLVASNIKDPFDTLLGSGDVQLVHSLGYLGQVPQDLRTDLSVGEFLSLWNFVESITDTGFTVKEIPGTDAKSVAKLDRGLRDIMYDSSIAAEKKSIAILNGTTVPALAEFGERVVENVGGRVIATGNARDIHDASVLIVDDASSKTVSYLVQFFGGINVLLREAAMDIEDNVLDRADITLVIGLDIADNL
jgi:hypothetical protein